MNRDMFFKPNSVLPIAPHQRVVLVIGGSGLLGKALLGQKPESVFFVNISKRNSVEGKSVANFHFDVTKDPEQMYRKLSRVLPCVDVLAYAARFSEPTSFGEMDIEKALEEYNVNVLAAAHCTKLCGDYFWGKDAKTENIRRARKAIWISSIGGIIRSPHAGLASYNATKAAMNALAPFAHDYLLETYGIPVAVLAPRSLRIPSISEKMVSAFWELQEARQERFLLEKIV